MAEFNGAASAAKHWGLLRCACRKNYCSDPTVHPFLVKYLRMRSPSNLWLSPVDITGCKVLWSVFLNRHCTHLHVHPRVFISTLDTFSFLLWICSLFPHAIWSRAVVWHWALCSHLPPAMMPNSTSGSWPQSTPCSPQLGCEPLPVPWVSEKTRASKLDWKRRRQGNFLLPPSNNSSKTISQPIRNFLFFTASYLDISSC